MQNNSRANINFLHHSCPICESRVIHYNFESGGDQICQCNDCDFLFLNSKPTRETVYDKKSKTEINDEEAVLYLKEITNYYGKKGGSLLIVGYGNENLLSEAKKVGFNSTSIDNLKKDLPQQKFDICILANVLGYEINPALALKQIHESLVPDGVLFIITPSLKNIWSEFKTKQANYFDHQTIQNVLNKTGFNQVYISSDYKSVLARSRPLSTPKLSVIMPVFNEVNTFSQLVTTVLEKKLLGVEKEIIIVESNSTDGTREKVLEYKNKPGVLIVLEEKPKGKGAAVRNGLSHATGDFVLIQDGDLEYDVNDYDQLLIPLLNYQKAFVLGSRHQKGFKMRHFETAPVTSFIMNVGQKFFVTLLNIFCWQKLNDPFTMYKVFRRDCLSGLTFRANRFDFDFELVIKLLRKGYVPLEIPINYKSRSFSEGKKVSVIRDPLTWIVALFRFRFDKLYQKRYEKQ